MDVENVIFTALSGITGVIVGAVVALLKVKDGLVSEKTCNSQHKFLTEHISELRISLREDIRKLFEIQNETGQKLDRLIGYLKGKEGQDI